MGFQFDGAALAKVAELNQHYALVIQGSNCEIFHHPIKKGLSLCRKLRGHKLFYLQSIAFSTATEPRDLKLNLPHWGLCKLLHQVKNGVDACSKRYPKFVNELCLRCHLQKINLQRRLINIFWLLKVS